MAKSIAVIGLPATGKTTLLKALCCALSTNSRPLNEAAEVFFEEVVDEKEIKATDPNNNVSDLKIRLSVKNELEITLSTRDYAGEAWEKFNKTGDDKLADTEIGKFIKSCNKIVICFDLSIVEEKKKRLQKSLVRKIYGYIKGKSKICIVITKWDKVKDLIDKKGGLDTVLKKELGTEVFNSLSSKKQIFPVSVAEFQFDPKDKTDKPISNTPSIGVGALQRWLFGKSYKRNLEAIWKKILATLTQNLSKSGSKAKNAVPEEKREKG